MVHICLGRNCFTGSARLRCPGQSHMKAFWYPHGKGAVHALLTFCSMQKYIYVLGNVLGTSTMASVLPRPCGAHLWLYAKLWRLFGRSCHQNLQTKLESKIMTILHQNFMVSFWCPTWPSKRAAVFPWKVLCESNRILVEPGNWEGMFQPCGWSWKQCIPSALKGEGAQEVHPSVQSSNPPWRCGQGVFCHHHCWQQSELLAICHLPGNNKQLVSRLPFHF